MPKPIPHDPSLRVPASRLLQTSFPEPPADADGVLQRGALARAALQPLHFLMDQLWLGAAPLADLLGLPHGALFDAAPGAPQPDRPLPPDSGSQMP